jgi:hypothetical protein
MVLEDLKEAQKKVNWLICTLNKQTVEESVEALLDLKVAEFVLVVKQFLYSPDIRFGDNLINAIMIVRSESEIEIAASKGSLMQ